jgi:hypothetical protein
MARRWPLIYAWVVGLRAHIAGATSVAMGLKFGSQGCAGAIGALSATNCGELPAKRLIVTVHVIRLGVSRQGPSFDDWGHQLRWEMAMAKKKTAKKAAKKKVTKKAAKKNSAKKKQPVKKPSKKVTKKKARSVKAAPKKKAAIKHKSPPPPVAKPVPPPAPAVPSVAVPAPSPPLMPAAPQMAPANESLQPPHNPIWD